MWRVEMLSPLGVWIVLADGYASRDEAEWSVAQWKHKNDIRGDKQFRYVKA